MKTDNCPTVRTSDFHPLVIEKTRQPDESADTISLNSSVSRPSDPDCYWVKSGIETNLSPTKEPM